MRPKVIRLAVGRVAVHLTFDDRLMMKARRASSGTRIEFSTRRCCKAPMAQSLYTVAVQTPSRFATSRTPSILLFLKYGRSKSAAKVAFCLRSLDWNSGSDSNDSRSLLTPNSSCDPLDRVLGAECPRFESSRPDR